MSEFTTNFDTPDDVQSGGDFVGGSQFESGIYKFNVEEAYGIVSAAGAQGIVLKVKSEDGRMYTETIYVTSNKSKGCKSYYEKDGVKKFLPGYELINDLCLFTTAKPFKGQPMEKQVVKAYDFEAKKELPKEVPMLVALLNKPVHAAILQQTVNKRKLDSASGTYKPSAETRNENTIDKFLHPVDFRTVTEVYAKEPAAFFERWKTANDGKLKDKTVAVAGQNTGTAGAPGAAADSSAPSASDLFN